MSVFQNNGPAMIPNPRSSAMISTIQFGLPFLLPTKERSSRSIDAWVVRPRLEHGLHNLCTIICRTPGNNRFSPELEARRTRESKHLHYAVNRRVAGSNPA